MSERIEVEIKFHLKNASKLAKKLGAPVYSSQQIDDYYNPPHKDFAASLYDISEWLRLRHEEDGAGYINYKHWLPEGTINKTHCNEYETKVEDLEAVKLLLEALGFKQLVTVNKQRSSWMWQNVEISIDSVAELGDFIELEYKGEGLDVAAAQKQLFDTLAELGAEVSEQDHRGYPWELLIKKRSL